MRAYIILGNGAKKRTVLRKVPEMHSKERAEAGCFRWEGVWEAIEHTVAVALLTRTGLLTTVRDSRIPDDGLGRIFCMAVTSNGEARACIKAHVRKSQASVEQRTVFPGLYSKVQVKASRRDRNVVCPVR